MGAVPVLRSMVAELVEMRLARYLVKANKFTMQLPQMRADDGTVVDARLDVVVDASGAAAILFHSQGGTKGSKTQRNHDYKRGLALLLSRLAQARLSIRRIEVASEHVMRKGLSLAERTISIEGKTYPLALGGEDFTVLSRAIGSGAKSVGQIRGPRAGTIRSRFGSCSWRLCRLVSCGGACSAPEVAILGSACLASGSHRTCARSTSGTNRGWCPA